MRWDKVDLNKPKIQAGGPTMAMKGFVCDKRGLVMDHPKTNWKAVELNKSWREVVGLVKNPGSGV